MRNLLFLCLFLSTILIVPLIVYMVGFALQSDKVQWFAKGLAKVLLVPMLWFFLCVVAGNIADSIFPHAKTGEWVLLFAAVATVLYSCLIVGLYKRGRISFFKPRGASC